jgi:hypothetical protein
MEFVLHPDLTMGIYVDHDEMFGRREWAFPLTDDERSDQYRTWRDSQQ